MNNFEKPGVERKLCIIDNCVAYLKKKKCEARLWESIYNVAHGQAFTGAFVRAIYYVVGQFINNIAAIGG